jgi:hypothetical protein
VIDRECDAGTSSSVEEVGLADLTEIDFAAIGALKSLSNMSMLLLDDESDDVLTDI